MPRPRSPVRGASSVLEFRHVTVRRGDNDALKDLTFRVAPGEHLAILGPNGSGKSTLIKCITRECYPWEGSVKIFGRDRWDVFALRPLLGIVSPDLQQALMPLRQAALEDFTGEGVTARDTVLSGFFSSIGLWSQHRITAAMRSKAQRVLRFLEIEHLADRKISEMSSGEARRALIGRALVHDPRALVLDEPTTSLDFLAARRFLELVRKIARSGKTVILVTHHLDDIIPEIRRVILLRKGRAILDGPAATTLTSRAMSRLFQAPMKVAASAGRFRLV